MSTTGKVNPYRVNHIVNNQEQLLRVEFGSSQSWRGGPLPAWVRMWTEQGSVAHDWLILPTLTVCCSCFQHIHVLFCMS